MGRYTNTGPGLVREPPMQAGDIGFLGVNNRLEPSQLAPGLCAQAVNMRFTKGVACSRKGIRKLIWLNRAALFDDYARKINPYGIIYGTGKFKDPNGLEWDVVAADGAVYLSRENQYPALPTPLPFGVTITGPVTFTQAFNVLILFRGESLAPLQLERIDEGFKAISAQLPNTVSGADSENPIDGTEPIPNAARGLFFQNRVFIPFNRDLVAVSDYLNYTRYSPILSAFRINQGSSDALVVLGRFNETTLIAFKEQSIYAIGNITGNLSGATLYEITSEYGCKAPKSIAAVGKDLWFLADKRGVVSITLTEQNKIQGLDVPVSQDIQGTIDRINWRYAAGACAAYWQNRLYMAVPLDNAEISKPNLLADDLEYDETEGGYLHTVIAGRSYRWKRGANDSGLANMRTFSLLATDEGYDDGVFVIPVVPGRTYRWRDGGNTEHLETGTETFYGADGPATFVASGSTVLISSPGVLPGDSGTHKLGEVLTQTGDFTAASAQIELLGDAGETVTASLCPLFTGINNAVLVYDFQAGKWSGHDESVALMVKDWSLTTIDGRQRLIYFAADGTMNLYEEAWNDENVQGESISPVHQEPIVSAFTSRGYLFETLEPKSFLRVLIALATLHPNYTVELLTDGADEAITVALDRTKNRAKYYRPHDRADFALDNHNGDYLDPFREDYAWILDVADHIFLDAKIDPELTQVIEEKFWARGRGKYAQVRITNRTGRMEILSLNLEAVLASRRFGVHA